MVTQENVEKVVYIFKNHRANARGLLKDLIGCNEKQFKQIETNFDFNGYSNLLKPKKKRERLGKFIKILKIGGIEINKDGKSIAAPEREFSQEEKDAIEKLKKNGFVLQKGIY